MSISIWKTIISRHVNFNEHLFPYYMLDNPFISIVSQHMLSTSHIVSLTVISSLHTTFANNSSHNANTDIHNTISHDI